MEQDRQLLLNPNLSRNLAAHIQACVDKNYQLIQEAALESSMPSEFFPEQTWFVIFIFYILDSSSEKEGM
jgi:hypothetical protein